MVKHPYHSRPSTLDTTPPALLGSRSFFVPMSTVAAKPAYSLKNPFIAHLARAHDLTAPGAAKHTRHYEIDLSGSGMEFIPGDSLAILPTNDPALVAGILKQLGFSGNEEVPNPKGGAYSIRQALTETYAISEFDGKLLKAFAEKTGSGNSELAALATPERRADLEKFQWGRDVLDVLIENPEAKFEPGEFV